MDRKSAVMEKSFPRTASQSSNKYQRLILTDGQGMRVQATIFGKDIESLSNTLYTLGHYYVSNAIVRPIPKQHRIVNNKYQWTLSTKTPIREVSEEELDGRVIAANFNLVSFSHLPQYVESGTLIGISVSTKSSTTVLLNPQTQESQALQDWVLQNEEQIKLLKKDKAVPAPTMNARAPPAVIPINSVSETTKIGVALELYILLGLYLTGYPLLGKGIGVRQYIRYRRSSGPRCSTKVHSYSNLYTSVRYAAFHYHDLYCRSILYTDRCNFKIELADGVTSLTATIFGENAEKVFKINAKTLTELSEDPHQAEPSAKRLKSEAPQKELYFLLAHSKKREHELIVSRVTETLPTNDEHDPQ
ncbi:hypothetical protein KSS87_007415 [Heliosperma pusillum]|nr:hypothetical protein KSS87_007415 [Heliosperma pusillum]